MTSTEQGTEVANLGMSDADLNAQFGFDQNGPTYDSLPRLRINKHPETEDDPPKTIPVGTFFIYDGDKPPAYAKEIKLRVLMRAYQYRNWNEETKEMADESVILPGFKGEFISKSGKIKCGKLSEKELEGVVMTPEQAALQKGVKCKLLLFCLASFTGKTADGDEVEYTDKPVLFSPGQSAFMPINDAVGAIVKQKLSPIKYAFNVTLQRKRNGDTVYYSPIFKANMTALPYTKEVHEAALSAADYVKGINKSILAVYNQAVSGTKTGQDKADEKTMKDIGGNVTDLDDEIPL